MGQTANAIQEEPLGREGGRARGMERGGGSGDGERRAEGSRRRGRSGPGGRDGAALEEGVWAQAESLVDFFDNKSYAPAVSIVREELRDEERRAWVMARSSPFQPRKRQSQVLVEEFRQAASAHTADSDRPPPAMSSEMRARLKLADRITVHQARKEKCVEWLELRQRRRDKASKGNDTVDQDAHQTTQHSAVEQPESKHDGTFPENCGMWQTSAESRKHDRLPKFSLSRWLTSNERKTLWQQNLEANPSNDRSNASPVADAASRHVRLSQYKDQARLCVELTAVLDDPSVAELDLSSSRLAPESLAKLGAILPEYEAFRVRVLSLHGCALGVRGLSTLATGLAQNDRIERLDLSCNRLGREGADVVGVMLAENSKLLELILADNRIDDSGAAAIFKGVSSNSALLSLDLADNRLGSSPDKGVALLREFVEQLLQSPCCILAHVSVERNLLSQEACQVLLDQVNRLERLGGAHCLGNPNVLTELDGQARWKCRFDANRMPAKGSQRSASDFWENVKPLCTRSENHAQSMCFVCEGWSQREINVQEDQLYREAVRHSNTSGNQVDAANTDIEALDQLWLHVMGPKSLRFSRAMSRMSSSSSARGWAVQLALPPGTLAYWFSESEFLDDDSDRLVSRALPRHRSSHIVRLPIRTEAWHATPQSHRSWSLDASVFVGPGSQGLFGLPPFEDADAMLEVATIEAFLRDQGWLCGPQFGDNFEEDWSLFRDNPVSKDHFGDHGLAFAEVARAFDVLPDLAYPGRKDTLEELRNAVREHHGLLCAACAVVPNSPSQITEVCRHINLVESYSLDSCPRFPPRDFVSFCLVYAGVEYQRDFDSFTRGGEGEDQVAKHNGMGLAQGLRRFALEVLRPMVEFASGSADVFRRQHLFRPAVDLVFRKHQPGLEELFHSFASGPQRMLSLEGWMELLDRTGVINPIWSVDVAERAFRDSLPLPAIVVQSSAATTIERSEDSRGLGFPRFLEALARLADSTAVLHAAPLKVFLGVHTTQEVIQRLQDCDQALARADLSGLEIDVWQLVRETEDPNQQVSLDVAVDEVVSVMLGEAPPRKGDSLLSALVRRLKPGWLRTRLASVPDLLMRTANAVECLLILKSQATRKASSK